MPVSEPVHERLLSNEPTPRPTSDRWFAVRQPGIVRFLSERLHADALALALAGARRIAQAFEGLDGAPKSLLDGASLERAEEWVHREVHGDIDRARSVAARQPVLVGWIADLSADPPVLLDRSERRDVGMALLAVVHAFDVS